MDEAGEGHVMTRFLLGALGAAERERVLDRLAAEPQYFEEMAATEDDLILKYHHHQLAADDRALFDEAYLRSPARRARVDEMAALIEAARAAGAVDPWSRLLGLGSRALGWFLAPFEVLRVAVAAMLVAVLWLAGYAGRTPSRRGGPVQPITFATTLTAVGEKGLGAAQGMDRVRIPAGTVEIRLSFEIESPNSGEQFVAELDALDDGAVAQRTPPLIEPSPAGATVTVTIAAPPDGDYVLRLRRVAGGPAEIVARHAFRLTRASPVTQ